MPFFFFLQLGLPEFPLWLLFDREDPRESGQFHRTSWIYLGCLPSCLRSSLPDRMFHPLRTAAQPMEMENHTCVEVGVLAYVCLCEKVRIEPRAQHLVSSSRAPCIIFWVSLSHLTWNTLIWTQTISNHPLFSWPSPSVLVLNIYTSIWVLG